MDATQEPTSSMLDMFRFVSGKVLKNRWLLILNVAALTIITLLQFVVPQIEQYIIDSVIPNKNLTWLAQAIALLLGSAVALGIFNYLSTYYMTVMSQAAIFDLRDDLYRHILSQDTRFFESSRTGDLMTRLTSDIGNLQSLISANMLGIVGNLFTFVGVLIFIYWINWQMALAVNLTFPLEFLLYRVFRGRIHSAFQRARASQARMSNQMQQTLTQIDLIKSYTSEDLEADQFDHVSDENRKNMVAAGRNQAIFSPLVDGINTLGIAIVLLLGAYFIINDQLKIGQMVAYLSYVAMVQAPISSLTRLLNQLQQAQVSYGRVRAILDSTPQLKNAANPVAFPKLQHGITLDHVTFNYDHSKNPHNATVTDVSFQIPYGETTALVGHSGSGKTTLTRLIDRLYDLNSGDILFDDTSIKTIDIKSLRENVAIVSQDVFVIDGSIRDNVVYGRQDASDDDVLQVLKLADLADFVNGLSDGLDTQVGERGVKLSGGQKQRLSIARALLKDAPIIILDEATASLDNESEKAIQHALDNLLKSRTALVIAHRLSTIHNADQIVVLDDGKVVETGNHATLMAKNGAYAALYNAQFE